jgi:hypothetical protein
MKFIKAIVNTAMRALRMAGSWTPEEANPTNTPTIATALVKKACFQNGNPLNDATVILSISVEHLNCVPFWWK